MNKPIELAQLNGPIGVVIYKMLYDTSGKVTDYEFSEANKAFFDVTGYNEDIFGKTSQQVVKAGNMELPNCIEIYNKITEQNSYLEFDRFSIALQHWYYVHYFSPEKGLLACTLTPVNKNATPVDSDTLLKLKFYRNESLLRVVLNTTNNIAAFLDYALNEAIKLTGSDIGYIYMYNDVTEEFTLNSWSNKVMDSCKVMEKQTIYQLQTTGFWGEVVRQKKAIINNNFEVHHPLKRGVPEGHTPLKKFMSLPIYDKGRIVAVIGLANKPTDYDENDIQQIQVFMEDVWMASKRLQAELELVNEKEQLNVIIESVNDGIISLDTRHNIILANKQALKLLDYTFSEIKHANIIDILTSFCYETKEYLENVIYNGTDLLLNKGMVFERGGSYYFLDVEKVKEEYLQKIGYIVIMRNITDEYRHTEQIKYMSYHDTLTGLYNRRFYEEELLRLDNDRNYPLSIIIGDVNGLKLTNDAFGHAEGDRLLINIAHILQQACRKGDIIARWGGDEFIFLLPNTSSHRAIAICKNIQSLCEKSKEGVVDASISLGTATKIAETEDIYKVLSLAEDIMYKNKLTEGKSQRSNIIEAIKKTLFARNHETEEHAERLLQYCELMAEKLGLTEDETSEIRLFAVLHDIGKIGISDHILLKKDTLDEDEWYEMKKHPVIGYRIALASFDLQNIALNILHHHERWDGSGYPDGLKGDNIPLLSRILAVVDAYDAMTSDRPYRKAMSKEAAIEELKRCAGTQFDKSIVSVFTKYIV